MIAWEWLMLAYLAGLATGPVATRLGQWRRWWRIYGATRRGKNWFHG